MLVGTIIAAAGVITALVFMIILYQMTPKQIQEMNPTVMINGLEERNTLAMATATLNMYRGWASGLFGWYVILLAFGPLALRVTDKEHYEDKNTAMKVLSIVFGALGTIFYLVAGILWLVDKPKAIKKTAL